jgi:hypothetical protein
MDYEQVIQAHAKVIWHGSVEPQSATTLLTAGHDGTGIAPIAQTVVAPPGASRAEILLMGGWAQSAGGFTRYVNMAVEPMTSPDLATLSGHPEQLQSLWRELPDFLIESETSPSPRLDGVSVLSLGVGGPAIYDQVRLLTASDLTVSGEWAVNALADRVGLERLTNRGGGALSVSRGVLNLEPPGSKIVWLEYKPGDLEPANAEVGTAQATLGKVSISCHVTNCTIANILLVPPLTSAGSVSRFAYAYSPLLRTPAGTSPMHFEGDWASLYGQVTRGYPSALYDGSTLVRVFGLVVGHVVAFAGLFSGLLSGWSSRRPQLAQPVGMMRDSGTDPSIRIEAARLEARRTSSNSSAKPFRAPDTPSISEGR